MVCRATRLLMRSIRAIAVRALLLTLTSWAGVRSSHAGVVIEMPSPPTDRAYVDSPSATPKRYRIDDSYAGTLALQRYSNARVAPTRRGGSWGYPYPYSYGYGYAPYWCSYGYRPFFCRGFVRW